jgi:hypothetical protein
VVGLAICDNRFFETVFLFTHQASDFHVNIDVQSVLFDVQR